MEKEVLNLDKLRAPSRKVIFLGKEYELGYIPSGASIPLIESYNALLEKQAKAAGGNDLEALAKYESEKKEEIFNDTVSFITGYCSFFYPEITKEEILKDASKDMVITFFSEIISAIVRNSITGDPTEKTDEEVKKKQTGEK